MSEDKWEYILKLDEELLKGGIILSEWTSALIRDSDKAFCADANIATIVLVQAGLESYLKAEFFSDDSTAKLSFFEMINDSSMDKNLKCKMHDLRKNRNKWMHINDPWDDAALLKYGDNFENTLEQDAKEAIKLLRQVIYQNPCV